MRARLGKLLVFIALAGSLVMAQNQHQPPDPAARIQEHINFLTTMLSLSSAQQQQATTLFTNAATTEKALHQQMRSAHEALHAAIQKNDSGAIDSATATIGNLTGQMMAVRAKAEGTFYQSLSPEQQNKMSQLHKHGGGMHGHGGPGMGGPF